MFNGDFNIELVLVFILNIFGSLFDEMKYLILFKKVLNIICGKIIWKKYKFIVNFINKFKNDLENICWCEINLCLVKDILKDFLEFLIYVK